MAPKTGLKYFTVIEERDKALVCECKEFIMTGKACVHILTAALERDFGPVDNYKDVETIRKDRGPEAKGQLQNPTKATKGCRFQARADSAVMEELDDYFAYLEENGSGSEDDLEAECETTVKGVKEEKKEGRRKGKEEDAPKVVQKDKTAKKDTGLKKTIFTKASDGNKPLKQDARSGTSPGRPSKTTPLHPSRTPVKFSKKTGPKPKPHNSLLQALSPAKSPFKPINFSPPKVQPGNGFLPKKKATPTDKEPDGWTGEEIQNLLSLNYDHWMDRTYWLRQDEMHGLIDLLNAISIGLGAGVLVVPDTYKHAATMMKSLDWARSDNPPHDLSGKIVIEEESLIGKSWSYSQAKTLQSCVVLHHRSSHWLLFEKSYGSSELTCYESRTSHGRKANVGPMDFFTLFFDPGRGDRTPDERESNQYTLYNLGVQQDGSTCGFWAMTFALLIVCGLCPADKGVKKVLKSTSAVELKRLWEKLMVGWRTDPIGLPKTALADFLCKFPRTNCLEDIELYIATRPSWISQHTGGETVNTSGQALETKPSENSKVFAQLKGDFKSEQPTVLSVLNNTTKFAGILAESHILTIKSERLGYKDLKRLELGRWINDELINTWRELLIYRHNLPTSKSTWIFTTFFFPQLQAWYDSLNDVPKKKSDKLYTEFGKWYKTIDLLDLDYFFIPIHLSDEGHWILAEISYPSKYIILYDSWKPTQKRNQKLNKVLQAWVSREEEICELPKSRSWKHIPAGFKPESRTPSQDNTFDCGVFLMIYLHHFLLYGKINAFDQNPTTSDKERRELLCASENMLNLRQCILRGYMRACTLVPTPIVTSDAALSLTILSPLTPMATSNADEDIEIPDSDGEPELSMDIIG